MTSILERIGSENFVPQLGKSLELSKDFDSGFTGDLTKEEALPQLKEDIKALVELQQRFYADNRFSLLLIFQAMDAAGKDGTIKHVMSGLNPQGCRVSSFKTPTARELNHDFLWRCNAEMPERGQIGIFNRSYYEETLVVRVHPELLANQHLPSCSDGNVPKHFWDRRFEQINNFENYLVDNGVAVMKFFLNVSKKQQKKRFLNRINRPEKNWKFSAADAAERKYWVDYQHAYAEMLTHTSTETAPWHVIPADHKWFTHLSVAALVLDRLQKLDPKYPTLDEEQLKHLQQARQALESE
jgi:PPK2 family polyphosphate:nucleotide phosphotransferase